MSMEKLHEVFKEHLHKTQPADLCMQVLRDTERIEEELKGVAGNLHCLLAAVLIDDTPDTETLHQMLKSTIRELKRLSDVADTTSACTMVVLEHLREMGLYITSGGDNDTADAA